MAYQVNKNTLILLILGIGLIVLPHIANLPAGIISLFYVLLGWRLLGVWRPTMLPNRWVLFLLTVLSLALLFSQYHGFLGRDAGTRLFVIALGLKLMEIRSSRDIYLITFLAFIVAASQFLYQQSIWMGGYILGVCWLLLTTLVSINSTVPGNKAALKTAGALVIQALPMALIVFMLFPRIPPPRWLYMDDQHHGKMGLSDTLEPGSINELSRSDELVFRVKFLGDLPPPAQRYWRGPVLTFTDGKKWTQANKLATAAAAKPPAPVGAGLEYTLLMEPQEKNWVFALDMPTRYSEPLSMNANYQLITGAPPQQRAEYKITSHPVVQTSATSDFELQSALQLPGPPSARIMELVRDLHGLEQNPENFIKQLLRHFQTDNFRYTLKPPLMDAHPIESFLFEHKAGFCGHYATAFTYLMRAAHIPARIIAGYQGGELNKMGHFLDIRQAHAHAWTEVWLKGKGWVRVDPTAAIAPERIEKDLDIERQIAEGVVSFGDDRTGRVVDWLKHTRQFWGNVDYSWQRWVINYDAGNQSKFLHNLGIQDLKAVMLWMAGIIAALTGLLSWWLLRHQKPVKDPVLITYERFCRKLDRHGLVRHIGEGPRAFGQRVKARLPAYAQEIEQITALFIQLHYGRHPSSKTRRVLTRMVDRFKITPSS